MRILSANKYPQNYKMVQNNNSVAFAKNIQFEGKEKKLGTVTKNIANFMIKTLEKPKVESFVKTLKNKYPKFEKNLFAHLIVAGSTILSGFYVIKTCKNKEMDEDKRKTLAVNQALVWVVSTVMAYTFDNWAGKKFDAAVAKFEKANEGAKNLSTLKGGIKIARTTIIIDTVYRFIAPVLVTPLANHIGNKINANKQAKLQQIDKKA